MSSCDHADEGFCHGGPVVSTPLGTDLTLCRRHANIYRRENGQEVAETTRPRRANGEAIPGGERRRK